MSGFPINPPRTPLVDQSGNVTPEWYRFFVAIQKVIGSGTSDPFEDAIFAAGGGSAHVMPGDEQPPALPILIVPEEGPPPPPVHVPVIDDPLYPPRYGA